MLGLGVAKLNIHYANTPSFILSTKTFLRTVCSLRYSVKKLNSLITVFFLSTCPGGHFLFSVPNLNLSDSSGEIYQFSREESVSFLEGNL